MIRVENVSKQFNKTRALKNVSLEVNKGDIISLIGPSGSGKSTLLRCIHGLEHVDTGKIYMDNEWMNPDDEKKFRTQRNRMGFVFQHFNLFPHMSVFKNMTIAPTKLLKKDKEEAKNTAMELLKRVNLENRAEAYPSQLSGGQKQRLTIARAVVKDPDILILDDSASALDFATDASLRAALKGMHGDKTIFIVSQRTSSIQFADNIIVLDDGQMVGFGPHEKLLETCETYKEIYDSQFKKESDMTRQKEV